MLKIVEQEDLRKNVPEEMVPKLDSERITTLNFKRDDLLKQIQDHIKNYETHQSM